LRNYGLLPAFLFAVVIGLIFSPDAYTYFGILTAVLIMAISSYAQFAERRDIYKKIQTQGDTANRLLDQITIGYNNAVLVQEIGQALSNILDIDHLLKFIAETLEKRLNFAAVSSCWQTPRRPGLFTPAAMAMARS
jgi:ABC-type antimicrobial peptide transport system permease subunit